MVKKAAAITLAVALALLSGCGGGQQPAQPEAQEEEEYVEVPPEYQAIYDELDVKLEELDNYLTASWDGARHDCVYSVELIAANSHRGPALLSAATFDYIVDSLDSLQDLGVGGLTLSINYPIISPSYDSNGEYLDFYRRLAAEIKARGFLLIVETGNTFRSPAFSGLKVDYSGLTLDRYKQEKRGMAEAILRELQPDYLTIENEPTTQEKNTGLDFTVAVQTDIVNYVLGGLDRGGTRMGAGAGTWEDLAYVESLAANTSVDFIDMHIYPIQGDLLLDLAESIAETARSHGKGVAIGEAWLYKLSSSELGSEGGNWEKIYARDAFSFWAPLDERFLAMLVELSHYLEMEFISPYWMQYLYAYLDYDPSYADLDYTAIMKLLNQRAAPNISAGLLSPTGEVYRDLIR